MKIKRILVLLCFSAFVLNSCGNSVDLYDTDSSLFEYEESVETTKKAHKANSLFDDIIDETTTKSKKVVTTRKKENTGIITTKTIISTDRVDNADFKDSNKKLLSKKEQMLYDEIYKCWIKCENKVKLNESYNSNEIAKVYNLIQEDYPEIFWISTNGYSWVNGNGYTDITFEFISSVNSFNLNGYRDELENEVQKILSLIPKNANIYDKVLFVHDYLVENTQYAKEYSKIPYEQSEMFYNSYGCLVNHYCVCSGYSDAFHLIMKRLGVICGCVIGSAKENGEAHQWNYVYFDGEYYWIDVTWDDPLGQSEDNISHDYYCIDDEELLRTHNIDSLNTIFVPKCNSKKYSFMRYMGYYLENYSFNDYEKITSKMKGKISIQFGDANEMMSAVNDLVYNGKIYDTTYYKNNCTNGIMYQQNDKMYILTIWPQQS